MDATTLTAIAIAIVTQDQVPLRAAPRESAPQQAVMWQGDSLEIRGEKGDYLQVYDHRHERSGYVRISQVRVPDMKPEASKELMSVVRFLRDAPGSEALGIAYAAAYLRAAPAAAIDGEAFGALGTLADRLARDASAGKTGKAAEALNAHIDVAAGYGVNISTFERDGKTQACYDGEAWRRVLTGPAPEALKAEAALALTRYDCIPADLTPTARFELDTRRAETLDRVDVKALPATLTNRLHMRRAGVWASLAFQQARRPDASPQAVHDAGTRAVDELAAVDKGDLADTDAAVYNDAAMRVGASRWAADPVQAKSDAHGKLSVAVNAGQPGETCVHLVDKEHAQNAALATRCTYGLVWTSSAVSNAQGTALALAVQPLDTWREVWVFRVTPQGWTVDAVPPAGANPSLGYAEFAGWVPGRSQMLLAREARVEGRYRHAFEVLRLPTLDVEKTADRPDWNATFFRWQSPAWKARTVSIR